MGRIFSLILWFLGVVLSFVVAAWWFNTIIISLALRWAEWHRPLRRGPLWACALALFGLWGFFATASVVLVLTAFQLLESWLGQWLKETLAPSIVSPGYWVVFGAVCLVLALSVVAGFSKVLGAWGSTRRRRRLEDLAQPPLQPMKLPRPEGQGRRIVILCDGTSNRPDETENGESTATNVWKLADALICDETQTVWYQAGVGSDTSSTARAARRTQRLLSITGRAAAIKGAAWGEMAIKLIESAFGVGISESIVNGYSEIVRQYQPGDRIYLIGFSRGAFAARCIAGVISRCGLLRAEHLRYAPEVVQIYRTRDNPNSVANLRPDMVYPAAQNLAAGSGEGVEIEFIGVFDTVASLGFPLWGWWFRALPIWNNKNFATDPVKACKAVYHALSMDERRSQFFPTLFTSPPATEGREGLVLKQVWFRGAHADIGGGYGRDDASDISLRWMMQAMQRHGLIFRQDACKGLSCDPLARLHDELMRNPTWRFFGSWPRWHPAPGPGEDPALSELHESVIERARRVESETGRPDLLRLAVGRSIQMVVDMRRDWYRTGVFIEKDAKYRITYLGGFTWDGECPPCRPNGQDARAFDLRRFFGFGRRLPRDRWMTLGATVAHPRVWEPKEKPFWKVLAFLFVGAPKELLDQIALIGRDLAEPGAVVYLANDAPSGLLHFFANDWWQTAPNNSGGPRLKITRIADEDAGAPLWSLKGNPEVGFRWVRSENGAEPVPVAAE